MLEKTKDYLIDCDCKCNEPKLKNSYNTYDYKCKKTNKNHLYEEAYLVKRPYSCTQEPGKSLLKCSRGATGPLSITATNIPLVDALLPQSIPVGSITIDTRKVCNPSILLNFNMLINIAAIAVNASITFTVFKCRNNCKQSVGESFTFAVTPAVLSNQSFSFQICDCTNCCDCITYSVEITNTFIVAIGVTIYSQISALAVENIC